MRLRRLLRTTALASCIVAVAAPPGLAADPVVSERPVGGGMEVRVGEANGFSRVEFTGARGVTSRREGQDLVLRVTGPGNPDLALLRVHPPKFVKAAKVVRADGGLDVRLTLDEGADAKVGQADGGVFVHLFPAAAPPPEAAGQAVPIAEVARADPRPPSGVVRMEAQVSPSQLTLRFPWAAQAGAAVFRRGEAIWVVFDTAARLDLSQAPKDSDLFRAMRTVQGEGFSAVRIAAPSDTVVRAIGEGSTWAIILGPGAQAKPGVIQIARQTETGPPTLQAQVAGSTKVVWIDDPVVGDRIAAVTALAPSKGLPSRREYVDMAMLPSAQGLAIEPIAGDVEVSAAGDIVRIGRPSGLNLSSASAIAQRRQIGAGLPQAASMPAVIDYKAWGKTGSGGFLSRYGALQDAAAEEVDRQARGDKNAGVAARMGLARFLAGSELYFEAIGVLDMTAKSHPELLDDAQFRGLRGASKVMAGRIKEAQIDFSAPVVADEASSSLWRGFIASELGQWQAARNAFQKGGSALNQFAPALQAKFGRADAESALKLGDLRVVRTQVALALVQSKDPVELLRTRLVQARLLAAEGSNDRALAIFDAIARAPLDEVVVPAVLYATQLRLAQGKITPAKAVQTYDGLRYRWRGDATELEIIRSLGGLYLAQGRYRECLEVLRSAGQRMPDEPEAVQLQADLQAGFRALFLEGRADGLEPVQALAMFYDFRELTPIGADGDLMVRRLARRLVDVDLLDRAAELLKYQAENRLDGVPRAQVATDLATIYLMDRKPEQAIQALNASRTTVLPAALAQERRLIEARAWLALNQVDHAVELIGNDASAEALDLSAQIAWRRKDWLAAGTGYERALGDVGAALAPDQESKLLRAGVAYSLAGDEAALERLRGRYGAVLDTGHSPDALKVALTSLGGGDISAASFSKLMAQDDAFAGWVTRMKQRFRDKPAPVTGAKPKVAAADAAAAG